MRTDPWLNLQSDLVRCLLVVLPGAMLWGGELLNRNLDTMDLTLHLERDGAFAGRPPIRRFTLDSLCAMFDIIPHDRHTAAGDAFITAQVFLRLLRLSSKHGRGTLGRISELFPVDA